MAPRLSTRLSKLARAAPPGQAVAIVSDNPYDIPATSALIKFESVGRLGSVKEAARELRTSSSSVSRCMRLLERQLSARLVERGGKGVRLTEAGRRYHDAVTGALGSLRASAEQAADMSRGPAVVIACSHDTSHLLIMPRFPELESLLGEEARIRVLTYQRHIHELQGVDVADIVLSWQGSAAAPRDRVVVMAEEAQPVCSPAYLAAHASLAGGSSADWGEVTLLDLKRPNMGWATWADWFAAAGRPGAPPRIEDYDTYTQILEAAAAGRGVALGWRHCIERHLERGELVALHNGFAAFGGCYVAALTSKGRRNPLARRCLEFFEHFA